MRLRFHSGMRHIIAVSRHAIPVGSADRLRAVMRLPYAIPVIPYTLIASSVRLVIFMAVIEADTWLFTVARLICSVSAMSVFDVPQATSDATSRCLGVSTTSGDGVLFRVPRMDSGVKYAGVGASCAAVAPSYTGAGMS